MKRVLTITVLTVLALSCADDGEKKKSYRCEVTSLSAATSRTNLPGCGALPQEVKIYFKNIQVTSGSLATFFYSTGAGDGFSITFDPDETTLTHDETSQTCNEYNDQTSCPNNAPQNYCVEIHNVNEEAHIQLFANGVCDLANLVNEIDGGAVGVDSNSVQYTLSGSVNFDSIVIEAEDDGAADD